MKRKYDDSYKIRNVKKGTLSKMDRQFKGEDSRNKDIWNSHKEKYSKKEPNCLLEILGDKENE